MKKKQKVHYYELVYLRLILLQSKRRKTHILDTLLYEMQQMRLLISSLKSKEEINRGRFFSCLIFNFVKIGQTLAMFICMVYKVRFQVWIDHVHRTEMKNYENN